MSNLLDKLNDPENMVVEEILDEEDLLNDLRNQKLINKLIVL